MNDRDALLATILAEPDEDTPRLVYADWLQEHGEEDRARFIRAQGEVGRTFVALNKSLARQCRTAWSFRSCSSTGRSSGRRARRKKKFDGHAAWG